jgi:cytochrome c oxidase subunit IV
MAEHASSSEHGNHTGHVVPVSTYIIVFVSLLLLTGLTTGAAYIDMGPFNTVVALAIAVTKMLLVVLFFMHVKYSSGLTKLVVIAGIFWLGILLALTLADEHSRGWTPVPQPWNSPSLWLPFFFHLFL